MKKAGKIVLYVVLGMLAVVLIGPFLVPVPPLEDTVPAAELADPDSRFVEVNNVTLHYKIYRPEETSQTYATLLLLHGFAASTFSWREVAVPLAQEATVIAFDRPAFGLSGRPLPGSESWPDYNPYAFTAQPELTMGLLDTLDVESAILVGNSAGGTVAVATALAYPERVTALILVDPAIYHDHGGVWQQLLFNTPQMRHLGPLIARRIQDWGMEFGRSAWHDPTRIPPEFWEGYRKPLQVDNWDRAFWEFTRSQQRPDLPARLEELQLPVLVITGDDDRIVPPEKSARLAAALPQAELVVLPDCGHIPQEECPAAWLTAVEAFLENITE